MLLSTIKVFKEEKNMVSLFFILFVALTVFFGVMNEKKEKKSLKEAKTFYHYDDKVHIS